MQAEPEIRFEGFVRSKAEGAASVAAPAAATCAVALGPFVATPIAGPVAILLLGLCGTASVAAGVAAAVVTPPAAVGRVAVVAMQAEPEIRFEGFVRSKAEGAAGVAAPAAATCAVALGPFVATPIAGPVAILLLGLCGTASVAAGVAAAVVTPPAAQRQATEATLEAALRPQAVQAALRDRVADAARSRGAPLVPAPALPADAAPPPPDYRGWRAAGVDTVLEVGLIQAGTQRTGPAGPGLAGPDPPLALRLVARSRLVRTSDNAEILATTHVHEGGRLRLAQWSADGARPLLRALEEGYAALGIQVHEQVFQFYPMPDRAAHLGAQLSAAFGLAPIDPPTRGALTGDRLLGDWLPWFAVDSLQPLLRWQAFPRDGDRAAAPEEMRRARNVCYDLVLATEHELAPQEVVYRRECLPRPEHRIELPLQPATHYFWTVRARFEMDGRERLTEWGSTNYQAREQMTAPSQWSYRFRTP